MSNKEIIFSEIFKNNNYTFEIITEQWLKENLKKINFDLYQDLKPLLIQYLRK